MPPLKQLDTAAEAVTNAARIGYECGLRNIDLNPTQLCHLECAARRLAEIECQADFEWEAQRFDWESTCSFIAVLIRNLHGDTPFDWSNAIKAHLAP